MTSPVLRRQPPRIRGHAKGISELKRAREMGVTVKQMREVEDWLRAMPMELFLDRIFGPGQAVYEPKTDLWLVPDPQYDGLGLGFIAFRRDKTFFRGVVQYGVLH